MKIIRNGKVWGEIEDTHYTTHRDKGTHLCRKYHAYGIQKELLGVLSEEGVTHIIVVENDVRKYLSSLDMWKSNGITDTLRAEDGEQVFLPIDRMRLIEDKSIRPLEGFV